MMKYKFRAWDTEEKCFLNSFSMSYNGEFSDTAKGVMNNYVCYCDLGYQEVPNNIIVEPFINALDKNGKEIYVGDYHIDSEGDKFIVKYDQLGFFYYFEIESISWCLNDAGGEQSYDYTFNEQIFEYRPLNEWFTIDGNIHEGGNA